MAKPPEGFDSVNAALRPQEDAHNVLLASGDSQANTHSGKTVPHSDVSQGNQSENRSSTIPPINVNINVTLLSSGKENEYTIDSTRTSSSRRVLEPTPLLSLTSLSSLLPPNTNTQSSSSLIPIPSHPSRPGLVHSSPPQASRHPPSITFDFLQFLSWQFRGVTSLVGVVLFWTGGWNLLDNHLNSILKLNSPPSAQAMSNDPLVSHHAQQTDPNFSLQKEITLWVIGLFFICITGGFFREAGINVHKESEFSEWTAPENHIQADRRDEVAEQLVSSESVWSYYGHILWVYLSAIFCLLASLFYWVGFYNLWDVYWVPYSAGWDVSITFMGLTLLHLSGSFLTFAGIAESESIDLGELDTKQTVALYLRGIVSLLGGVFLWKGMNNLLAVWTVPPSFLREVLYAIVGLCLILIMNSISYVMGTFHPDPQLLGNRGNSFGMFGVGMSPIRRLNDSATDWTVNLFLYGRALFILIAGFVFWTGAWNLLSDYVLQSTVLREFAYIGLGITLLILTESLIDQASVSPIGMIRASRPQT